MRPLWGHPLSVCIVYRILTDTCVATTPAGVYARHGGPVTVTWAMPPIKGFIVKKDYREIFQITDNRKVTVADKKLRTRINANTLSYTSGTFSFSLYNVTSSDAGQYSCYVDSSFPPYKQVRKSNCGQTLYVVDLQDPYIITEQELVSNRTLNLTCLCKLRIHPETSPSVTVVWSENNDRLYSGQRNQMLSSERWSPVYDGRQINYTSILTVRDGWQQNDTYKCRVGIENIKSEWSEEIYPLYWSDDNTNYTVVPEGDNAMMTWKMPLLDSGSYITSPSGKQLMWKLSDRWNVGDIYIPRLEIRGTRATSESFIVRLLLHNVTGLDAGKYLCVNGSDHVPQCGHTVIVSRRPVKPTIYSTHQNQSISLTCSSTSRSLPQDHSLVMSFSWRRDNTKLLDGEKYQMSGSTLTITAVREEDSGNYSCQSTEVDGHASEWSSQFQLNVQPRSNDTMMDTRDSHTGHSAFCKESLSYTALPGTVIGCSIATISLLVAAIVLLIRQNNARECRKRKRRFPSYKMPTENTGMSLQDLTDPDYDFIDETCMVHPEGAGRQRVNGASCSLSETVRSGKSSLEHRVNITHGTAELAHAEGDIPVQSEIAVHQRGMPRGISEDGRMSVGECGVVVQELDTVLHDDSVIPLRRIHDQRKGRKGDTSSSGPGWVTSPEVHAGTVMRIMSDLDNIIAETIAILNQREGRQTSTEGDGKGENVEYHQDRVGKAVSQSGVTIATQQERCLEYSSEPFFNNGANVHDKTELRNDGYESFVGQGQDNYYTVL